MLLIPYLLLVTIVLVSLSGTVYNRCLTLLYDTISASQKALMDQTIVEWQQELATLQRMAESIGTNEAFTHYRLANGGYDSYLAQQELNKLRLSNSLLTDVWFYPIKENMRGLIYTADTSCPTQRFFDHLYREQGKTAEDIERLYDGITAAELREALIAGIRPGDARPYMLYSYPLREGASVSSVVTFVMERQQVELLLNTALAGNDGYVCLSRYDNPLFCFTQGELSIDDEPTLAWQKTLVKERQDASPDRQSYILLTSESVGGYQLTAAIPSHQLYQSVQSTRTFYTVFLGLAFLLATLGCYALAVYNYRPIKKLVNSIPVTESPAPLPMEDELETVAAFMRRLQLEKDRYQRNDAFQRMIASSAENDLAAERAGLEKIGCKAGDDCYAAILLHFTRGEELGTLKITSSLIENTGVQAGLSQTFCFPYFADGKDILALLVAWDGDADDSPLDRFTDLVKRIFTEPCKITIGIGSVYCKPEELMRSFWQARETLYCAMIRGRGTVLGHDEKAARSSYRYPFAQEQGLLNAIRQRQKDEVMQTIDDICTYIQSNADSREQISYICQGVMQSSVRLFVEMKADLNALNDNVLLAESSLETAESFCARLKQICITLLDTLDAPTQPVKVSPIAEHAARYIKEHFASPECTAETVAQAHGLSLSYLTRIFKEQFGCTLVQSIDNMRMEKARELLTNTDLRISSLIAQCGFTNESNFIRKFKKVHGVPPIQYRSIYDAAGVSQADAGALSHTNAK